MPVRVLPLLFLAAMLVLAGRSAAQESFTLTEEDQWESTTDIDPETPEGMLAEARRALAAGDAARAEILATSWIDRHLNHPLLAEAHLVRGDALRAQGDEYEALFDYELISREFPAAETFVAAQERALAIAEDYAAGKRRKLFGLRFVSAEDEAEELFIRVQERLPGSRLAERAGMALADFYFERRKMSLAVDAYELFLENYPRSEQISKARRRLIYAYLASFKGPEFDPSGLYEARIWLRRLQALEPTTSEKIGAAALIERIDQSDARKRLVTAKWYLRTGDVIAAEWTIRTLVEKYPRSLATAEALRLMNDVLPRLPASVLEDAPDYAGLQRALLEEGASGTGAAANAKEPAE